MSCARTCGGVKYYFTSCGSVALVQEEGFAAVVAARSCLRTCLCEVVLACKQACCRHFICLQLCLRVYAEEGVQGLASW